MEKINQDLDEGLSGDARAIEVALMRARIRKLVEGPGGYSNWAKAKDLGQSLVPSICAQTVINFAYGKTRNPSPWTLMAVGSKYRLRLAWVPEDAEMPEGTMFL